jgi:hypothetical protein
MSAVRHAGYRSGSIITSRFTIVFSYIAFLIGRRDYGMDYHQLRPVIARWFFMCAITGRYTGSSESRMEQDLRRFAEAKDAQEFANVLDGVIATQLTNDFWEVALPDLLATSAGYSPSLFAYHAALVLLDADVLFTSVRVGDLLDPGSGPQPGTVDRYQLFRRKYLESLGINGVNRKNQLANYAILEWPPKSKPSAESPLEYFRLARRLGAARVRRVPRPASQAHRGRHQNGVRQTLYRNRSCPRWVRSAKVVRAVCRGLDRE